MLVTQGCRFFPEGIGHLYTSNLKVISKMIEKVIEVRLQKYLHAN